MENYTEVRELPPWTSGNRNTGSEAGIYLSSHRTALALQDQGKQTTFKEKEGGPGQVAQLVRPLLSYAKAMGSKLG